MIRRDHDTFLDIALVINMFRLEGVCNSKKSPLAPLFERGNACRPAALLDESAGLEPLQVFTRSPFGKGGQGDFEKEPIGI
jgi:hypothetical protein